MKKAPNPEDADPDDDTEEVIKTIVLSETVVKRPQKKMPSYLKPTAASDNRKTNAAATIAKSKSNL